MKIPFVDLKAQHDELREEIDSVIKKVIDHSSFIGGSLVDTFEKNFAAYCGVEHAIGCGSGTDALKLALMAVGVKPGEEVVTVPNTFIATVEAITQTGAIPVFVDIDADTYCMSVEKLSEFFGKECRIRQDGRPVNMKTGNPVAVIVPVHLYGLPADMKPIMEIAAKYNLKVIEDACQAHGAIYYSGQKSAVYAPAVLAHCRGRKLRRAKEVSRLRKATPCQGSQKHKGNLNSINTVNSMERYACKAGSLGDAAAFSFYPGKNLGAMGDGGAVVSSNDVLDVNIRIWRDHGQKERYIHASPNGWNSRLDALQAAILDVKLKKLDDWNSHRRQAATWYMKRLSVDERIVLPNEPDGRKHVYHLFVVRLPDRDKTKDALSRLGIGVGLHYPIPLHLQTAYRNLGFSTNDFPEAEAAASSILSLPMFPHITEEQIDYVSSSLQKVI